MEVVQECHSIVTQLLNAAAGWARSTSKRESWTWSTLQPLPVAGLDVPAAQAVLYALRTSHPDDQGNAMADTWLQTLLLAQVASDRLLQSLAVTHHHLNFWRGRLAAGSHGAFMLLSQGPAGFVHELMTILKDMRTGWTRQHKSQQQLLQVAPAAAAAGVRPEVAPSSDRIAERVIVLQLLFTQLCEALAAVHSAAAKLKILEVTTAEADRAGASHSPGTAIAAVAECVNEVTAAVRRLMPQVDELQQYESAVSQIRSRLAGDVTQQTTQHKQQQSPSTTAATVTQPLNLDQLHSGVIELRDLLRVHQTDVSQGRRRSDAGVTLSSAAAAARHLGPLTSIPAWAAMPSSLQRHWIKYSIAAAASISAAAFLYRHSRLAGSSDLDDWAAAAAAAVRGAWSDHVVSPLVVVRDELFSTFRDRPSMVSSAEFKADKESLLRMLTDFQEDHPALPAPADAVSSNTPSAAAAASTNSSSDGVGGGHHPVVVGDNLLSDTAAVNQGMQVVMRCYERDLKSPIRNLITGELARTLLIQVQRLKLDTEAAMLELDQILRANELSISLVAAVPALLLSWTLLRGVWLLLLAPAPPDPKRQAMPCRLAMAKLERALLALQSAEGATETDKGSASAAAQQQVVSGAQGAVLFRLHQVYVRAQLLYRLKDRSSKYSEWPQLQADLMDLVQPGMSAAAKLDLHSRMTRTFTILRP